MESVGEARDGDSLTGEEVVAGRGCGAMGEGRSAMMYGARTIISSGGGL